MQRKKIVLLGGGTGASTILRGLKYFPVDITAVITVSGGSGPRCNNSNYCESSWSSSYWTRNRMVISRFGWILKCNNKSLNFRIFYTGWVLNRCKYF